MIKLKSTDNSSFSDINNTLYCQQVMVGESISFTIPKSLVKCKPKLAIVECNSKNKTCEPNLNPTTLLGCVYSLDNDERAYVNLVIKNRNLIPNIKIGTSELIDDKTELTEYFEYEDGGTYDDLIAYLSSNENFGFEETPYGVKIFFNKELSGKDISLVSDNTVFLIGKTFCLKKSSEYGISFCLNKKGCWQILLYTGMDTVLAYSGSISVVDFTPTSTSIVEWHENGFYHRERLPIWTESSELLIEETETVLSSGKINISDSIIRVEKTFYTDNMSIEGHKRLIKIMKAGFRIDNQNALLRGDYSLIESNKKYIGSGRLNFPDDDIIGLKDCTTGCDDGSIFKYEEI
jgi:hypothetical protein